jgi:hypothetical protein
MVQIKRIGVKQTAKVTAVFYFLISLIFVLPITLFAFVISLFNDNNIGMFSTAFGGLFFLILPFLYALMGYFLVAIMALMYNIIAKKIGGVEIEIDSQVDSTSSTKSM